MPHSVCDKMSRSAQNVSSSRVIVNNTTWHHDMIIKYKEREFVRKFFQQIFVLCTRETDFVSMPISFDCFWRV